MKKIINNPDQLVDGVVEGILLAHPDQARTSGDDRRVLVRADNPAPGRVGIVTGGDFGYLPLFRGYVGRGLRSGVATSNVFSLPSVQQCTDTVKVADGGASVLFLYGNYNGDVFNFDLAVDLLGFDDIETRTVFGCDDAASQFKERAEGRHGVADIFFAYKAAGAVIERGDSLDEVAAAMQKVVDNIAIMGVGLPPMILPTTGAASFDLSEDGMKISTGIHGEPDIHHGPLGTVDETADQTLDSVIPDLGLAEGDHVTVLVNGLGVTSLEELYLPYRRTHQRPVDLGAVIERRYIGEYATSLEMAGAPVSLLRVDDELLELLDMSVQPLFFREV